MRVIRWGLYFWLAATAAAFAQSPVPPAPKLPAQKIAAQAPPPIALGIVTGPKAGTYIQFGRDLSAIAKEAGLDLQVKESDGSIDNIRRLTSGENAAFGVVQSDVLGFLSRSQNPDSLKIASNLRLIFPFYQEEVHLLARKNIKNFADLAGKQVAVGEEGSGSMLTAVNLFALTKVAPARMIKNSPAEGIVAVLKGEADAVLFVGGKPVKLFKNMEELGTAEHKQYNALLADVHFIPLTDDRMKAEYKEAQITSQDYAFIKESVPTLAVTAALISYDFSDSARPHYRERCEFIAKLTDAVRKQLPELQKHAHAKWKQVNLDAELSIWKRDSCAWPEAKPEVKDPQALNKDLIRIIEKGAQP